MIHQWLDIAFSLESPFNYAGFTQEAERQGVKHALQESDYYQRIGMVKGKMEATGLGHQEAYQIILDDMQAENKAIEIRTNAGPMPVPKPCCGGKAER